MRKSWMAAGMLVAGLFAAVAMVRPAAVTLADESKTPVKIEPWKSEDFIYSESAGQYRISPDAKWLVWVKSAGDKEKDARVSNLFLSSMTESREIQLTRGTDTVTEPRWSPDGEWIAFLSTRTRPQGKPDNSKMQIWLINPRGGEPWPITELARSPRQIEWLDKDTLIYSAEEDPALYEEELKKKKDDSEVVDDEVHASPVRLYKISVKGKKITRLTTNTDWIETWGVSRDGKYAAARHGKSLHYAFDEKVPPVTILHDLTNGTEKQILTEGRVRPYGFEWTRDNSGFYVTTPFSTSPLYTTASISILYYYDVASGKSQQVNLDWENGVGRDLQTIPGGFITFLAAGSRDDIARYSVDKSSSGWNWKREAISGENVKNLEGFYVSEDGKSIAYSSSSASRMSQLFRAQLTGSQIVSPVQITKLNEGLVTGRRYAKSEIIRWKGSNDEEVEGILYYPAKYEAGKKYPLITAIHGGPAGEDRDLWGESWAYPIQMFTDRGSFVLRPNYHGSANYGLKWVESICCGKYYDLETPDINAGVDYLIAQGKADPDQIATMGWSNGSILSTSLITTYPARYKVASAGAGDVEWLSDWGNVDFGQTFDAYYFGKSPFEDPELYIRKSPFFKMDKVQAPVLIFHGTADRNVPPAQSWSYFRALQFFNKTVKYVVFPGEPHGPRKLTHQMRKVDEEVAWFDKYFFKSAKPENEALKKDSMLADALTREKIQTTGAFYGAEVRMFSSSKPPQESKRLEPQIVAHGDLSISRFEVTRAQFVAFDKNYKFPAGTENYPANGITFEQAKAYVAWLGSTSKDWPFRIPYEDEVKDLYENHSNENTLDYWAGYAPNFEDTKRLRELADTLPEPAGMLKEVGSFIGHGDNDDMRIYDLGGNVAEWVMTRDGKGKAIGGSADCPAAANTGCEPQPEYIGIRIVYGTAKPAPTASDRH